jgi:hypothetical protein
MVTLTNDEVDAPPPSKERRPLQPRERSQRPIHIVGPNDPQRPGKGTAMAWTWTRHYGICAGVITAPDGQEVFLQGGDCYQLEVELDNAATEEIRQSLLSQYSVLLVD